MIDSIYTRQLESVLFSINQHSDDVVSGWAADLEDISMQHQELKKQMIDEFIHGHRSVNYVLFSDSSKTVEIYANQTFSDSIGKYNVPLTEMVVDHEVIITRLLQYIQTGYRKIQPVDIEFPNQSLFLFALQKSGQEYGICGLIVNTEIFIRENLGPKIQSVAQNTFFISVFDRMDDAEVYSNELAGDEEKNIEHKKVLWLFPDYELGIELRGETIEDLVKQRTSTCLSLLF